MQARNMISHTGAKSANNILIQDNKGNLFLQSYNEIVAVKEASTMYIKESGFKRSSSTNRYINYFIERYSDGDTVHISDSDFEDKVNNL